MDFRLPRNVEPLNYEIHLSPDLEKFVFKGSVSIEVRVITATSQIVLNSADLSIADVRLCSKSGTIVKVTHSLDKDSEQLLVNFENAINPGTWILEIQFSGELTDKLRGFYRSRFNAPDGSSQIIATTQFEATDARRAFPCWDEPDRKATFEITLDVPKDLLAVSNTRVISEEQINDKIKRVRFARTIKMSTYLVAFVIGPLESTKPLQVDSVELSIIYPPGKDKMTDFALEIGAHALRFFSQWFGIDYPGDKLDLIAIPDFAFGAMENLGAVTFRETALLVDPLSASRVDFERVCDVVAHEIAHMWFGDLVTMKWWNGIWLNEAFATFAEMCCVDAFRPNWNRWATFGLTRSGAMATDELSSTRPIEFPVVRPEEAQGMFDVLTYEKGAGVLRMLERYLGPDAFLTGLRLYLNDHLYGNAETTDLWDAIESSSGAPIRSVMDSWIFQGGHPLVSCEIKASDDGFYLALTQEPFRLTRDRANSGLDSIGSDFQVPVQVRTVTDQSVEEFKLLLDSDGAGIELVGEPDLVVINSGGSGFYRSQYSQALNSKLVDHLELLDLVEIFNLVSDNWALAVSGNGTIEQYLSVIHKLRSDDPNVWTNIANSFAFIDLAATYSESCDDIRRSLAKFTCSLFSIQLDRIGSLPMPSEDEKIGTLRSVLLRGLGTFGQDSKTITWANRSFSQYLENVNALSPDLVSAVVTIVSTTGDSQVYDLVQSRYLSPISPQDEVRFLMALYNFQDLDLFKRSLEYTFSGVRTQNAPFVLLSALANRSLAAQGWQFIKNNWEKINATLPEQMICRALENISNLCSRELANDISDFFATRSLKTGQRTLDQTLERLYVNLNFVEGNFSALAKTFNKFKG